MSPTAPFRTDRMTAPGGGRARTRITQGFRLNWRRTMSHLATMASELRLKFGPLQALMEEISLRSR